MSSETLGPPALSAPCGWRRVFSSSFSSVLSIFPFFLCYIFLPSVPLYPFSSLQHLLLPRTHFPLFAVSPSHQPLLSPYLLTPLPSPPPCSINSSILHSLKPFSIDSISYVNLSFLLAFFYFFTTLLSSYYLSLITSSFLASPSSYYHFPPPIPIFFSSFLSSLCSVPLFLLLLYLHYLQTLSCPQ